MRNWIHLAVALGGACLVTACDDIGGSETPGLPVVPPAPATLEQGAFLAERVLGESSAHDNLMEVELVIANLPEFAGNIGESVVLRGAGIFVNNESQPFVWEGDDVRGVIEVDRSTTITFYQDLATSGQARTDFKVFRNGSWNAVLVDNTTTGLASEGNIVLDLLSIASVGDKVRVTVDASDDLARSALPSDIKGPAFIEYVDGELSADRNLLEVDLVVTNLPPSIGPMPLLTGESVVVRGEAVYAEPGGSPFTWEGDDVSGEVADDRTLRITFFQRHFLDSQTDRLANFKLFRSNSWDEVVIDRTDPNGNIVLDLLAVASPGQKVRVTIDASNLDSRPQPPVVEDGPFTLAFNETADGARDEHVEVQLRLENLPDFAGLEGDRVVVRGSGIYTADGIPFVWSGDDVAAPIAADRSALVTFFADPGALDLKLFREFTWTPVVHDGRQPSGDIRLDFAAVGGPGQRVDVTVDVSEGSDARPEVPAGNRGPFGYRFADAGVNAMCPDLIEVTLELTNLPATAYDEGAQASEPLAEGDEVVVRGSNIYTGDSTTTPETWNGDAAAGVVTAKRS
ncbi:MAG: hypothetical protein AAGA48_22695, partial [Myxococcota bacterium]